MARPRAILFDWDNTLVDTWGTIHEALNFVMGAMGQPTWSLAETRTRVRLSLRESFPMHFGERWEEARTIYLDRFREIHLDHAVTNRAHRRSAPGPAGNHLATRWDSPATARGGFDRAMV